MPGEPCLLAWSGGKDAAWTLHALRAHGVPVVGLVTTLTRGHDRVSMQGIRRDVLHAQAAAAGLPLVEAWIEQATDNVAYEAVFAGALAEASDRFGGVRDIAFGDLFLQDIRDYREASIARLGWRVHTPLFGCDTRILARTMMGGGLQAHLCCVDTTQLDAGFAGRAFDAALLRDLPAGIDPCGENGEFHTCVSAGPMFSAPLPLRSGEHVLRDGRFQYADFALA